MGWVTGDDLHEASDTPALTACAFILRCPCLVPAKQIVLTVLVTIISMLVAQPWRRSPSALAYQSRESRRSKRYRHGVDTPPLGFYADNRPTTRARSGSEAGEAVVAYDAYRRRWMPVPKRELEQEALRQAGSAA